MTEPKSKKPAAKKPASPKKATTKKPAAKKVVGKKAAAVQARVEAARSERLKKEARDKKTGQFLPGNRFWEARSSAGPKPIFETPEQLWEAATEYFQWVEDNPLYEAKLVSFQGVSKLEKIPKMRAMTIEALCLFLDVSSEKWRKWRTTRPDLGPIQSIIEGYIYQQKLIGASADLLNPGIIARHLGLADKNQLTGKDDEPLIPADANSTNLAKAVLDFLSSSNLTAEGKK